MNIQVTTTGLKGRMKIFPLATIPVDLTISVHFYMLLISGYYILWEEDTQMLMF